MVPKLLVPAELAAAEDIVRAAKVALFDAQNKCNDIKASSYIVCSACKMGFVVREQTYIQTHWYEGPRGCTDGDRWHAGEANWKCPKCSFKNRFDTGSPTTSCLHAPDLVAMKHLFKKIIECYCTDRPHDVCDACKRG